MTARPTLLTEPQAQAVDPASSFWVTASAGTGKTRVLTSRVLRLMLTGVAPDTILCITFTKAAAAEMATRILVQLGKWAKLPDADLAAELEALLGEAPDEAVMTRARRLFARVLDLPGGLRIQTIHSFCQALLGRFPLEADISPSFTVMDQRTAQELLADSIESVLGAARDGGDMELAWAIQEISGHVSETVFQELVHAVTAERRALARLIERHGGLDGLILEMGRRVGVTPSETDGVIVEAASSTGAVDHVGLRRATNALANGTQKDKDRAVAVRNWLASDMERRVAGFDAYRMLFLTEKGDIRKNLASKQVREIDPNAEDVLHAEGMRIHAVEDHRKLLKVATATAAVYRLGACILETYEIAKEAHALLDYDDLIEKAGALVDNSEVAPWVLYKLDNGIGHVLVDEAQDTNPDQWRIVRALSDEFFAGRGAREDTRTIFAVGDEKQSIFSFQGADPEIFDNMRGHFRDAAKRAEQPFAEIPLNLSFRSTTAVLSYVDAVFADPAARDGVPGAQVGHQVSRKGQAGLVEIWPAEKPAEQDDLIPWALPVIQYASDEPTARLANRIADHIRDWIGHEVLASRGRAVEPGDIMVLVRRRNEFVDLLVNALKRRGVPVSGTDRMVLTEQIAVMDLMALGRFMLLPEDDLTLAVVLKSPLIGLSEDDLFALAHPREDSTLWQELTMRRHERPAFEAAHDYLSALLARTDFVPPFEFFSHVLGALDGRRKLVRRLGHEVNDPIDEFLSLAFSFERLHAPSLEGFLHWVEAGDGDIKRDLEQNRNEVRVMTVHGAKGLEAPVVILPDTCQVPRERSRLLALPEDGERDPLFVWPVRSANEAGVVSEARAEARRDAEREYRRLLYVALTRAEDRLYVGGWETRQGAGRDTGCWYDRLAATAQEMDGFKTVQIDDGTTVLQYRTEQTAKPETPEPEQEVAALPGLPDWARRPAPPESRPPDPLAPSRSEGAEQPALSPLQDADSAALRRGRLAHTLLERLPDLAREERREAALRYLSRPVHRLEEAEAQALADEVIAVLEHPDFSALFGPGSRAEVPVAGVIGTRTISGQIDRLMVEDETVWIIDYKTNRPPPQTVDEVSVGYLAQMAAYRALLSEIYPGREIRAALLWTVEVRLLELPEALLDTHAPQARRAAESHARKA
jgi:ATP-dependent helicase/nuclease subunit A